MTEDKIGEEPQWIKVEIPPEEFDAWLKEQIAKANPARKKRIK